MNAPLPPVRLVDEWTASHHKFNGREPRTLAELAIARADHEHRRRIAEVKAMAPKLAQLDAFLPALAERGVKLWQHDITTWDKGKTLRIHHSFLTKGESKLLAALIDLGFREIERKAYSAGGRDEKVTLKHGRSLSVAFDVPKAVAPAAEGAAA